MKKDYCGFKMADQKLRSQLSDFFKPVLSVGADLTSRYIDLIPGGCGLGMLKGGLALVFEVRFCFSAPHVLITFLDCVLN